MQHPFAITRLKDKDKGYRLYTTLKNGKGEYIVVGVDIKNSGRNIEVNAISTVFGRRESGGKTQREDVIYTDKEITPEQKSLLNEPNLRQYPTAQESNLSEGKDNALSGEKQESEGESSEIKTDGDGKLNNSKGNNDSEGRSEGVNKALEASKRLQDAHYRSVDLDWALPGDEYTEEELQTLRTEALREENEATEEFLSIVESLDEKDLYELSKDPDAKKQIKQLASAGTIGKIDYMERQEN